ncbi:MAG: hypothetical protein N2688_08740 [Burkholderiaceae bacterium]|nr:hypothetical protein [Burkholderiaceae bacterium]
MLGSTAAAQSFQDLLKRGAEEVKRAVEQPAREAAKPPAPSPPPTPSAPAAGAATGGATTAASATPAGDLPPGWKPRGPYDEERTFVAPQATAKVAPDGVRSLPPQVIKDRAHSTRLLVDNPYLDPVDPFFNIPRRMACLPDGSLAVFSTAKLHRDGRMKGNPYATGLWRIAPDGAITAFDRARHVLSEGKDPECGVTVGRSGLDPAGVNPISVAPDGSLLFSYRTAWAFGRWARVLRVTAQGFVEPVPNSDPLACAPQPPEPYRKTFNNVSATARDGAGNTWVMDACQLKQVAPDGTVSTLLDKSQVCPEERTRDQWVLGDHMAWDAARGEMVMGGTVTSGTPRDRYSTIWRVRPDGSFRRVYAVAALGTLGLRQGSSVSAIAIDGKGVIHFGDTFLGAADGGKIVRLVDEAKGRVEVVAGAPRPTNVQHADGPARQAHFGTVSGLCFAPDGTLYVHDASHLIRKITPAGQVTTWAF